MSSPSIDQGTVDKLTGAVSALTQLQTALGASGVSDEHIQTVGSILSDVSTAAGQVAAAIPGRTAADVGAVASVVTAAVPTLESLAQDFENLWTKFKSFISSSTPPAA